jgi:hypothetical protein
MCILNLLNIKLWCLKSSNILFKMNDMSSREFIKRKSQYTLHGKAHFIEDNLYIVRYLTIYVVYFI